MTSRATLASLSILPFLHACTFAFHAGVGGMEAIRTDGYSGGEAVHKGGMSLQLGVGPCVRWPRLRGSLTLDGVVRAKAVAALAALEVMWIFNEGLAREGRDADGYFLRSRSSLALKGQARSSYAHRTGHTAARSWTMSVTMDNDYWSRRRRCSPCPRA